MKRNLILLLVYIHQNRCTILVFSTKQLDRQWTLHIFLDRASQWTSAERRIVSFLGKPIARRIRQLDLDVVFVQSVLNFLQLQINDLSHFIQRERREHDDLVNSVEKLGTECALQR